MVNSIETEQTYRPLIVAAFLIGVGQGGFFDGIVFHQLLQWHHLFSEVRSTVTIAGLEIKTIGDGLFHLFDWLVTPIGIGYLWRVCRDRLSPLSTPVFLGSLAIGAGTFNVVEGILDHHLLQIHHVKPGPYQLFWDLGFLAIGIAAIVAGWSIVRQFSQR